MKTEVRADADSAARWAAGIIAKQARDAVVARGRCVLAVSGGRTPWIMLRELAEQDVPWPDIDVVQVDERIAPANDPDRNLTLLRESLSDAPLSAERIHAMPVESPDLASAATHYVGLLQSIAGSPPVIDVVHLGLGADGHTASLVPGDPVLEITNADVALTALYHGKRRMTLTYPALNRARRILWVVTGSEKAPALARLFEGDESIPAGRVRRDNAIVVADEEAAGQRSTH